MWIFRKMRDRKCEFYEKMRLWKCEFCGKWDFQNVNFWINWGFLYQCVLASGHFQTLKFKFHYRKRPENPTQRAHSAATTLQKNWRKESDKVTQLKEEVRGLRTDEHIKHLTKELASAKQALERERKLRSLQMDAIKVHRFLLHPRSKIRKQIFIRCCGKKCNSWTRPSAIMLMRPARGRPDGEAPKSLVDPVNIPSLNWWRLCKPQLEVQPNPPHHLPCRASKTRPPWPQWMSSLKCLSAWLNPCQPPC